MLYVTMMSGSIACLAVSLCKNDNFNYCIIYHSLLLLAWLYIIIGAGSQAQVKTGVEKEEGEHW